MRLLLTLLLLTQCGTGAAVLGQDQEQQQERIGIVYPDVNEPYRSMLRSMIEGIEEGLASEVPAFELPSGEDLGEARDWLDKQSLDTTIVLTSRGLQLFPQTSTVPRIVLGAVINAPLAMRDSVRTISMSPSPGKLFERLLQLAPKTERITVVNEEGRNAWLLDLGRAAAQERGIVLQIIDCANIRQAASAYSRVLKQGARGRDALWLLQGSTFLRETSVLKTIVEEAWDRRLVVFSSNPSHVPKGALFALYPNNRKLGQELALAARDGSEPSIGITPVQGVDMALNRRTAEHLGIEIDRELREGVQMMFPKQ